MKGARRHLALGMCVAISCCALAFDVEAHDFWIEPEHFALTQGEETNVQLLVGHGEQRQRSQIAARRVARFEVLAQGNRDTGTLTASLQGEHGDGVYQAGAPRVVELVFQSDNTAISRLSAERFNAYIEEEGLVLAARARERTQRTQAEGSERYGRVAKALIFIGAPDRSYVGRPLGLPLEIVLEDMSAAAQEMRARIYYRGRPLAGALIDLVDLRHDEHRVAAFVSDQTGRIAFTAPSSGRWLLNVVWTRPAEARDEVDFETWFSSLTFGFD